MFKINNKTKILLILFSAIEQNLADTKVQFFKMYCFLLSRIV